LKGEGTHVSPALLAMRLFEKIESDVAQSEDWRRIDFLNDRQTSEAF